MLDFGAACGFMGFLFHIHCLASRARLRFLHLWLSAKDHNEPSCLENIISSTKPPIFALASPSINMNFLVMVLWVAFDNIRQHKLWLSRKNFLPPVIGSKIDKSSLGDVLASQSRLFMVSRVKRFLIFSLHRKSLPSFMQALETWKVHKSNPVRCRKVIIRGFSYLFFCYPRPADLQFMIVKRRWWSWVIRCRRKRWLS